MKKLLSLLLILALLASLWVSAAAAEEPGLAGSYTLSVIADDDGADRTAEIRKAYGLGTDTVLILDENGAGSLLYYGEDDWIFSADAVRCDPLTQTAVLDGADYAFSCNADMFLLQDGANHLSFVFDRDERQVFGRYALSAYFDAGEDVSAAYQGANITLRVGADGTGELVQPGFRDALRFDFTALTTAPEGAEGDAALHIAFRQGDLILYDGAVPNGGAYMAVFTRTEDDGEAEPDTVRFFTTDRYAQPWDQSVFAEHKLTMINFWEPWCGPCVSEMPDLEKLYQTYSEQGLLILGVYSTEDRENDVDAVLRQCGTSYPILYYCPAFDAYQTGYVPTTIFVNQDGQQVGSTEIGSKSYEAWAALVEGLLG